MQMNDLGDTMHRACVRVGVVSMPQRPGLYRNHVKRAIDVLAVIMGLPIVIPSILLLALVIMMQGNRPFYTSDRVGKNGRTFRMLKLRTMVRDADERLGSYLAANPVARAEWENTQKLKQDPRITSFGRFLRKSSLDELPQLWNVLVGDMSLVGPRPMMPAQRSLYAGLAYYGLRPGMSGFWQISDRNECGFEKRASFDADYDAQLCFFTDMSILLRTLAVVAKGTGY
ncbi:MAG: sugar transferase [Rhodobacteraceae bacterium]|nr:sugar transferase [Paracoccaceae bacterium]